MIKALRPRLMVLCAALAACADTSTISTMTAPDAGPARSEAVADLGVSYTPDGVFDFTSTSEESLAQLPGAQLAAVQSAASTRSASGSRSSGHVGLLTGISGTGIASERYSYVALSTDAVTLAAKGHYEFTLTTTAGGTRKVHGDVTCMYTFGNTTRMGGQITKYWVNGVQAPINPLGTHNIWVVVDNGEGSGTPPDQVSLMRFSNGPTSQFFCANGLLSTVFFNQEGNIQVQP